MEHVSRSHGILVPGEHHEPCRNNEPGEPAVETRFQFPTVPLGITTCASCSPRAALHRPREPDDRPHFGLSLRGLEPGPGPGAVSPLVHPVDRHRPVHGAAREHHRRHLRHALPSRKQALANLAHLVRNLRQDQCDPASAPVTCWGTSWIWPPAGGLAPWPWTSKSTSFRPLSAGTKPKPIWKALQAKGWIIPRSNDLEADIVRSAKYGWEHFDGPLAPFSDNTIKQKIMDILDQRVVMVVFIDNANLSAAAAKSIGALLNPGLKEQAEITTLRHELEVFSKISRRDTQSFMIRGPASFTSVKTPRKTGISAGSTCRGNGSRATSITWSTSFAAPPRSS